MVKFYQFFFFGQIWRISPKKQGICQFNFFNFFFLFAQNFTHLKKRKKKKKKMILYPLNIGSFS